MKQISFLILATLLFSACHSQSAKSTESKKEQVCKQMMIYLTSRNFKEAVNLMDDIVLSKISKDSLMGSLAFLADKLQKEYGRNIQTTFITSEKTTLNNLPTVFVILKVESETMFGYYDFYINDKNNKVILISEFAKIKSKRL